MRLLARSQLPPSPHTPWDRTLDVMAQEPTARRDAGLLRVSRLTRAGIVGGLAATGVFAALAAHGFAGATARQTTSPSADQGARTSTTTPTTPAPEGVSTSTSSSAGQSTPSVTSPLKAPTTTVRPSTRHGRVTSGGS